MYDDVKVGDKIIDKGRLFRIFKIENDNSNGKSRKLVHFRPYFKTNQNYSTVITMPLTSFRSSDIRLPVSKKSISDLKDILKKKFNNKIDTDDLKDLVNENEAEKTAKVAKYLWTQKKDESTPFSLTKRRILDDAIRSLSEEIAFVTGKKLENAEKDVKKTLAS